MQFTIKLIFRGLMISALLMSFHTNSNAEVIDKIVAQVNNKIITQYDLEIYSPKSVQQINTISDKKEREKTLKSYYEKVREEYVMVNLLEIAAARQGKSVTDDEINQVFVELSQQNQEFRNIVKAIIDREGKITPEAYLFVKRSIIDAKMQPMLFNSVVVTDKDVEKFLAENGYQSDTLQFNIQMAFFDSNKEYQSFLKSKQTDFIKRADEFGSSINMGYVNANEIIPSLRDELYKTNAGDITAPVTDESGRVVVAKLLDKKQGAGEIPSHIRDSAMNAIARLQLDEIRANWLIREARSILVTRYEI